MWGWVEWAHLFYFHSHTLSLTCPPQKKGKKEEEEEKEETSSCSAGSAFMLKNRTVQIVLVPYQRLRDFSFYSGGFRKVLAQKKVCVCVKQICTLLLHDSV